MLRAKTKAYDTSKTLNMVIYTDLLYSQNMNFTRASNTRVSNVSLSEFSIIMLKRASKVSCKNYTHTCTQYREY